MPAHVSKMALGNHDVLDSYSVLGQEQNPCISPRDNRTPMSRAGRQSGIAETMKRDHWTKQHGVLDLKHSTVLHTTLGLVLGARCHIIDDNPHVDVESHTWDSPH